METIAGNHSFAGYFARTGLRPESPPEIVLAEDTVTGDKGNFILTHWTLKDFVLRLDGGNMRRMFWRQHETDEFLLIDPEALPANIINDIGKYWQANYLWQKKEPNQIAKVTREAIHETLGQAGLNAWAWIYETLIVDQSLDEGAWAVLYHQWAENENDFERRLGKKNPIDPTLLLDIISDLYVDEEIFSEPPADKFIAMAGLIRASPVATWRGDAVETIEEWS